jgi:hypothetical protein
MLGPLTIPKATRRMNNLVRLNHETVRRRGWTAWSDWPPRRTVRPTGAIPSDRPDAYPLKTTFVPF